MLNNYNKTIIIGLSGGVDSAVAAFLLKQQGYNVIAIFMQNWDSYLNNEDYDNKKDKCDSQYEYDDAKLIAKHLGIKLYKVDFINQYWNDVFLNFIEEHKKARTPNPDVLCNKYIKFGSLVNYINKHFKFDYIATGHYAKIIHNKNNSQLLMCADQNKDQTYFLCGLNQEQLKNVLFPLANYTKQQVREIAKKINLPVWDKKDSTGICFIGERNFQKFLINYINPIEGNIIDITTNQIVGKHIGVMFYTIGQNNNLSISGAKFKYFVCKKDQTNNILYVCREAFKDQYLKSTSCICSNINWINEPKQFNNLQVRFRHRQKLIDCSIIYDNKNLRIFYPNGCLSVTPGQYAVIYDGNECLGGAIIDEVFINNV